MDGTILGQGSFTSSIAANPVPGTGLQTAGANVTIQIPSAADWVSVKNFTQYGQPGTLSAYPTGDGAVGLDFFWQRGMPNGSALVKYMLLGGTSPNFYNTLASTYISSGGFYIYDPSGQQAGSQPLVGPQVACSAATNVHQPVITTTNTAGLSVGSVVRLSGFVALPSICGTDFIVSAVTASTNFTILNTNNAFPNNPGTGNATAGSYQIVYNPPLFYPARKVVTSINVANSVVTTSIEHSLTVGQAIRFNIPSVSGTVQLNPTPVNNYQYSTVTAIVSPYSFVVDTNMTSYSTFLWPTTGVQPSDYPSFEPIGMNTAANYANASGLQQPQYQGNPIYNANTGVFADATVNTGYYGMILGNGGVGANSTAPIASWITGPSGTVTFNASNVVTAADTMYWLSGKADFGGL